MVHNKTYTILVAPLDWGLGHATRCIPIIEALERRKHKIIIAGCGISGELLLKHYPNLEYIDCPGAEFRYEKSKLPLLSELKQSIQMRRQIRFERKWISEIASRYKMDAIISDNRYGLTYAGIPSIFITHQLNVKTGLGNLSEVIVRTQLKKHIQQYDLCLIPDIKGQGNLSGELSHPAKINIPVEYIGWLSRVKQTAVTDKTDILILLSGPEPKRSELEHILLKELENTSKKVCFIRGTTADSTKPSVNENVQIYNCVTQEQLSSLIQSAALVICRSGYSSVMDIVKMQKKSVFIPTPQQPEQEYLAEHLYQQKIAPYLSQKEFTLEKAIQLAENFGYAIPLYIPGEETAADAIEKLIKAQLP